MSMTSIYRVRNAKMELLCAACFIQGWCRCMHRMPSRSATGCHGWRFLVQCFLRMLACLSVPSAVSPEGTPAGALHQRLSRTGLLRPVPPGHACVLVRAKPLSQ